MTRELHSPDAGCQKSAVRRAAAALVLAGVLYPARATIIDRVAVSIGNDVVTSSQIDLDIRITAFLNRQEPDFNPANRKKTAQRLVEQLLVRNELVVSHYPLPPASDAERMVQDVVRDRYNGDAARFRQDLERHGITEKELKEAFLWQLTFLRFVDVRFRPGVQVPEEEIASYFDKVVKPLAEKAHPEKVPTLSQYHDEIEQTLQSRRVDQELNTWLAGALRRAAPVYHEDAFR